MAKKKKEICPYCSKSFAYLSRHKCKIKERVEGTVDEKSEMERRTERIEEKKRNYGRDLHKDEKVILEIIESERDIYFSELLILTKKERDDLEPILEQLALQSKITMERELMNSSWTKRIRAIEKIDIKVETKIIDQKENNFVWKQLNFNPCFICPFIEKCHESNLDQFNPKCCEWLTEWIEANLEGIEHIMDFSGMIEKLKDI